MTFGERRDRLVVEAGIALVSVPAFYLAHFLGHLQMRNGTGFPGASILIALSIVVGFAASIGFVAELVFEKLHDHY